MTVQESASSIELPDRSNSNKVQLSDHVTFQWLHGGAAYFMEVQSARRTEADIYVEISLKVAKEWDSSQEMLSIHDVSHPDFQMTPYLQGRLQGVMEIMNKLELTGHSVVVMSNSSMGRALQAMATSVIQQEKLVQRHLVTDLDEGMALLKQLVQGADNNDS
jgi:hypothetical protein